MASLRPPAGAPPEGPPPRPLDGPAPAGGDGAFLDRLSAALEWDPWADAALWGRSRRPAPIWSGRAWVAAPGASGWCPLWWRPPRPSARPPSPSSGSAAGRREQRLDRLLTSHATGIPLMLLLLAGVLWLTITGANYPSQLLSDGLFWVQDRLSDLFAYLKRPGVAPRRPGSGCLPGAGLGGERHAAPHGHLLSPVYPAGGLRLPPRVAFVLDHAFQRAKACGKQALTMAWALAAMPPGWWAAGSSTPRERLIAILTNNFVPCNGRFPPPEKGQIAPPGQQGLQGLPPGGGVGRDGQADFNVSRVIAAHIPRLLFHKAMLLGGRRARAAPAPLNGYFSWRIASGSRDPPAEPGRPGRRRRRPRRR